MAIMIINPAVSIKLRAGCSSWHDPPLSSSTSFSRKRGVLPGCGPCLPEHHQASWYLVFTCLLQPNAFGGIVSLPASLKIAVFVCDDLSPLPVKILKKKHVPPSVGMRLPEQYWERKSPSSPLRLDFGVVSNAQVPNYRASTNYSNCARRGEGSHSAHRVLIGTGRHTRRYIHQIVHLSSQNSPLVPDFALLPGGYPSHVGARHKDHHKDHCSWHSPSLNIKKPQHSYPRHDSILPLENNLLSGSILTLLFYYFSHSTKEQYCVCSATTQTSPHTVT